MNIWPWDTGPIKVKNLFGKTGDQLSIIRRKRRKSGSFTTGVFSFVALVQKSFHCFVNCFHTENLVFLRKTCLAGGWKNGRFEITFSLWGAVEECGSRVVWWSRVSAIHAFFSTAIFRAKFVCCLVIMKNGPKICLMLLNDKSIKIWRHQPKSIFLKNNSKNASYGFQHYLLQQRRRRSLTLPP